MSAHLPVAYDAARNASEVGMARFFSPTNLGRYRALADDEINATERDRFLKMLAEEWSAFRCELRTLFPVIPARDRFSQ